MESDRSQIMLPLYRSMFLLVFANYKIEIEDAQKPIEEECEDDPLSHGMLRWEEVGKDENAGVDATVIEG